MSKATKDYLEEYEKLRMGKLRVVGDQDSDDDYLDARDGTEDAEEGFSKPFRNRGESDGDKPPPLDDGISAEEAAAAKAAGNELYKARDFKGAAEKYAYAASSAHATPQCRATYLANLAAAQLAQGEYELVEKSATMCLKLDADYRKARERRMAARESLRNYRGALEDAKLLGAPLGKQTVLERQAQAKEKKDTEKAMGELKGLADSFLSNFGMSVNDFQAKQDPETGSYSISMNNSNNRT